MIIGNELKNVLKDFYIEINGVQIPIKFEYGDADALQKFINFHTKKNLQKLPLIFYVTNEIDRHNQRLSCDTELIIMSKTKHESLSQVRFIESYDKFIEPIFNKLIRTIDYSKRLYLRKTNRKVLYVDKPNYGMTNYGNLTKIDNGNVKDKKSAITEFVDARIIKINIELNNNC